MKIIFRVLLIVLVFVSFSLITYAKGNDLKPNASNTFYPTQADMLKVSNSDIEISDKNLV